MKELRALSWGAADILMAFQLGEKAPFGFASSLIVNESKEGPVSSADLAVNKWLIDGIENKFPNVDWNVLTEESCKEKSINKSSLLSDWLWIIDPLDGTKDFLQGSASYAVHIALAYKNIPVLGVVLIPALEELWFGIVGKEAWCENRNCKRTSFKFSKRNKISDSVLVSSKNHRNPTLEKLIKEINFGEIKSIGSVGCKIAAILRGEADLYISISGDTAPKDWDIAAPEALLLAAGGSFTHADGRSLSYEEKDFSQRGCLIASHGLLHETFCKQILNQIQIISPHLI